jgi:hypothetical protein
MDDSAWSIVHRLSRSGRKAPSSEKYGSIYAILYYTAVELRTGVFAGEETPVLNQSEV